MPALLPFLVSERHYSYAAVAGLMLAAALFSSIGQPFFGWWTDRRPRRWLIPAGIAATAGGVGLAGFFPDYAVTWLTVAFAGLGAAAFHPEAARVSRHAVGNSNRGMSIFSLGGNIGFAVGSLIATPVLLVFGLHGTGLLVIPAVVMVLILARWMRGVLDGRDGEHRTRPMPTGADNWPAFLRLTALVVVRSFLFYGLVAFLALYFIRELGASAAIGGLALTVLLLSGTAGTLLGGWVADRFGRLFTIRVGFAMIIPMLIGLVLAPDWRLAMVFVVAMAIGMYMPFSVFVILGQDYLPNRIGTASGVTAGLASSVGGLLSPFLGLLADATSLKTALAALILVPIVCLVLSLFMHEASPAPRRVIEAPVALATAREPANAE